MKVVVLEDAAADIERAADFYELQQEGIGDYFQDAILADLDSLVLYAGVHAKQLGFHRAFSKRFPYAIYYLVEEGTAFVYAILDLRRDPGWIESTLSGRDP